MLRLVGQSLWLAIPVTLSGILHMIVVKKNLFSRLNVPLDGGHSFRGRRLLGDNKTWRGVVFMIAASALFGAAQGLLGGTWAAENEAACLAFDQVGPWTGAGTWAFVRGYALVNAVLGLGYVLGELPNSYLKRRLEIRPGETRRGKMGTLFLLFDQADSVIAALVLAAVCFSIAWDVVLAGIASLTLLHLAINVALYRVRIRKNV